MSKPKIISPQFWLAELSIHGNPTLVDGAHSSREGVEKALHLFKSFGFAKDRIFACAEVIVTEVEAKPHGANEDAIRQLQSIGLK